MAWLLFHGMQAVTNRSSNDTRNKIPETYAALTLFYMLKQHDTHIVQEAPPELQLQHNVRFMYLSIVTKNGYFYYFFDVVLCLTFRKNIKII